MLRKADQTDVLHDRHQPLLFLEDEVLHFDWKVALHVDIQCIQDAIATGVHTHVEKWCQRLEYEMGWFPLETSPKIREYIQTVIDEAMLIIGKK